MCINLNDVAVRACKKIRKRKLDQHEARWLVWNMLASQAKCKRHLVPDATINTVMEMVNEVAE